MGAGPVRDRLANVIDVLATTVSPRPPAGLGTREPGGRCSGERRPAYGRPILCEQSPVDAR